MKKIFAVMIISLLSSAAFAGHFICRSRTQNFVIKQGSESMYVLYECNKNLGGCMAGQVFESLGFEEEGSFSLHGRRATGQLSVLRMVKTKADWTASLSLVNKTAILDVLNCEYFKK